jgi:hypothetical protein
MTLHNTTVLPHAYYNAVSLLASGFLLFWFLWSLMRFMDMIRVRIAIISNRLVPIRGISNYLATLNEIISQTHFNAIIHTRQSHPPKTIKSLYLPFSIDSIMINHRAQIADKTKAVELELWISGKCKVFVFFDFKTSRLKELLSAGNDSIASFGTVNNPTADMFMGYLNSLTTSPLYEASNLLESLKRTRLY